MATRRLVLSGADLGQFFLLIDGDTLTVGRGADHPATVLQPLRVVRIHCELEVEGEAATVRTDASGEGAAARAMQPGEILDAGGCRLQLEAAAAAPPSVPSAPPAPNQPAPPRLAKRLRVIDGGDQGQTFPLPASGTVTLGKDRKYADIVLHDLYVARAHCRLDLAGDTIVVVDEGVPGTQGTLINGKKIARQELGLGDVLRIGNSHLRLEPADPSEDAAQAPGRAGEADEKGTFGVAGDRRARPADEPTGAADVEVEVVAEDEETPAALPRGASEAARLLRVWRDKLTQLSGQTVGHYRLGAVLGRGHSGVVFRAQDQKTGMTPAVKVLSPQFPKSEPELQRFARLMKGVLPLRHPNLVTVYGAGKTGGYTWVAREYVEGDSVAGVLQRLARGRQVADVALACRVAVHVGRALDFARGQRCRHGKVSPANILLEQGGRSARLADLMLEPALEESQLWHAAREQRSAADLAYLSPEQATPGAFVDELSDLYGLGAVVYALLTGRPPFVGDTTEAVLEQVRGPARAVRPSSFNSALPAALEKVVVKLLAKRQEDRYPTPAELLAGLEPITAKQGIEV